MSVKLLKQSAVSNPNLLINGDFQVWQRGTAFNYNVSNKYCADRWILSHGAYYNAMKIDKHEKGMQVTLATSSGSGGGIYQYVENAVYGKTYTFSVCVNDKVYILTGTPLSDGVEISKSFTDFKITLKWDNANKCVRVGVWFNTINKTYIVNWTKLEYGALNTMYVPRFYSAELELCKLYYELIFVMSSANYAMPKTTGILSACAKAKVKRIKPAITIRDDSGTAGKCSRYIAGNSTLNGEPCRASYHDDGTIEVISDSGSSANGILANIEINAEIYPS